MPYLVTCPKCANQLKSPASVPAGRAVSCPLCKAVFSLAQPARRMEEPTPNPPRAATPPPPTPRQQRTAEDGDYSPKRRDQDQTDELVRPRKQSEDDLPPRRRRSRRKGLVLTVVGLTAMFLVCVGAGLTLWLANPFGWFDDGTGDLLAWMPADTRVVEGMDPVEVSKNPHALAVLRSDLKAAESIGIKTEDMAAVMLGRKSARGEAEVTVVRLRSSADKERIQQAAGGSEATANGKKYYRTRAGGGLYFVSSRVVVLTRSEDAMTGLLQKERGKVVVPEDLKAAVRRADGHVWGAAVGTDANLVAPVLGREGPPEKMPPALPTGSFMSGRLVGQDEVELKLELTYPDDETARKAAQQIDWRTKQNRGRLADMEKLVGKDANPATRKMQDARKMFDTLKITATGPTVVITATLSIESLESFGRAGGLGGV